MNDFDRAMEEFDLDIRVTLVADDSDKDDEELDVRFSHINTCDSCVYPTTC
jgi:hypothetical protein